LGYKAQMDEFEIIKRYFAPLAGEGAFGLQDDAALIAARPGFDLVVTTDAVSEGTDFFAFDPADTIAQKALRVNLSDLAAKGAEPFAYLLNLSLPHSIAPGWLAAFAGGLARDQQAFGISLLGGDTGATDGPLTVAITAFGYVPEGKMVRRAGARVGDKVYVTGSIGEAGGGLAIFKREKHSLSDAGRDQLTTRYRVPEPPIAFAGRLREIAHAAVDVSDGLIADLGHIASASAVRILVDGEQVPLSGPLRALWGDQALLRAVTAGDDYQIAFTAPAGLQGPFTGIGRVEEGAGVDLLIAGRKAVLPSGGYRHF
jgi:thiamine-monophosphate kinase